MELAVEARAVHEGYWIQSFQGYIPFLGRKRLFVC